MDCGIPGLHHNQHLYFLDYPEIVTDSHYSRERETDVLHTPHPVPPVAVSCVAHREEPAANPGLDSALAFLGRDRFCMHSWCAAFPHFPTCVALPPPVKTIVQTRSE